ncbi:MAG: hypothetical protein R6V36_08635 [Psychroflexus sp.]
MSSSIASYLPSLKQARSYLPEISFSFSKAKTITLIATGLLAASSFVQAAEAGPVAYASCMAICTAATGGAFVPACEAVCKAALIAPGP